MKNLINFFWIITFVIISLSMTACKDEVEGWKHPPLPEAKGKLTISLIPKEHVGKYIYADVLLSGNNPGILFGMNNMSGSDPAIPIAHLVKIGLTPGEGHGLAEIPLYYFDSVTSDFVAYEGNHTMISVGAWIHNSDSIPWESANNSLLKNNNFTSFESTFNKGSLTLYWE
jgi:hypothetical protein